MSTQTYGQYGPSSKQSNRLPLVSRLVQYLSSIRQVKGIKVNAIKHAQDFDQSFKMKTCADGVQVKVQIKKKYQIVIICTDDRKTIMGFLEKEDWQSLDFD